MSEREPCSGKPHDAQLEAASSKIMKEMSKIAAASIRKYYRITEGPKAWIIHCKQCNRGYRLTKTPDGVHGGNLLGLLNHAYSHSSNDNDPR